MKLIEQLESRRLLAATAELSPGLFGTALRVALNDANDVSVSIEDGEIVVTSQGETVFTSAPVFGNPAAREVIIDGGDSGGDSIQLVTDYSFIRFDIRRGTGADHIHVEGRDGAMPRGSIHGENGADVFFLVNITNTTVYGDNGDDVCTFTNATNSFFDGGRGDDLELLL